MAITKYINDLLYRYECIILPGFGAFLTQNKPAHIDTVSHTFYPPSKTISFNRQLQTNDGLLANHIAIVEKCSYEDALQKLRNEVRTLKIQLENGKPVSFENIGSLQLKSDQQLVFSPDATSNFLTEAFGLSSFVSASVSRETSKEKNETSVLLFTPEKRGAAPYIKYAAIGLLALGLSSLGGLFIYNNQVVEHNLAEKQKANTQLENQIQQATFIVNNPLPSLTVAVKTPAGKYHVIAGAFRMEENAETKISELKLKGYPARGIGVNKYGLHQVVYNSFQEKDAALAELRKVQRIENQDAWLLVQELD
ncbi:MAG: SPOR domain-containing protein [Flavobacteriaceae bacterium]